MKRIFVVLSVALMLFGVADRASADPRMTPEEQTVTIETPAPGHTVEWTMRVRVGTVDLSRPIVTLREASGAAVEGAHPLDIEIFAPTAGTPLVRGTADALLGRAIPLDQGHAAAIEDGWITVHGTATLPQEAGNEYRGADATLRFTFTGEVAEELAMTGRAPIAVWIVAVAVTLAGLGSLIMRRRTRGADDEGMHA